MARHYTKKPEVYEAVQYDGTNYQEVLDFCPGECAYETGKLTFRLMTVASTDWILKDRADLYQMMTNTNFNNYFQLQALL
jgi:threonyl-tRNA synthetase